MTVTTVAKVTTATKSDVDAAAFSQHARAWMLER